MNAMKSFGSHKISLKINDSEIEGKLHTKYLGVILDEKLSWKQHIDQIIPKLQRCIGILAGILWEMFISLYLNHT